MTPDHLDLDDIRNRAGKATKGPWNWYDDTDTTNRCDVVAMGVTVARTYRGNPNKTADAQFIAHSRADIDYLLARVAELEQSETTHVPVAKELLLKLSEGWSEPVHVMIAGRDGNRLELRARVAESADFDPDDDTILDVAEAAYDAALDMNVPTRTLLQAALTAVKDHLAKGEG